MTYCENCAGTIIEFDPRDQPGIYTHTEPTDCRWAEPCDDFNE